MNLSTTKRICLVATVFVVAVVAFCSCGVDKFIPQGEYLLTKNNVEIDYSDLDKEEAKGVQQAISGVKSYIRQTPNSKLLGVPVAMRIYCLSSPTDSNWINRTIRRQGEAPVIYSQELAERSTRQIQLLLESKGCFGSQVVYDTQVVKNNRISVTYKIKPQPRYVINEVGTVCRTSERIKNLTEQWIEQSDIKPGSYYDQEVLAAYRERVSTRLRNRGYFTAVKENINFLIDTNLGGRKMNVRMAIRDLAYDTSSKVPPLARYYINNVYIYPDLETLIPVDSLHSDTVHYQTTVRNNDVTYHFVTDKKMRVRPETVCQTLTMYPGGLYRHLSVERTYTQLWALRNFKFVDMEFVPAHRYSDTAGYLDMRIRLMNAMRRSMSLTLELNNTSPLNAQNTSSTGNFGLELGLGYQNKNVFGGAEIFNVKTTLALELSKFAIFNNKDDFYDLFSTFESGLDMSLDIPKFLVPFSRQLSSGNTRPHTLFNAGINYQYRIYFERLIANTSFGYTWLRSRTTRHQFLPVEITLVKFFNQADEFRDRIERLNDLRLKYQYSDHLIFDMRYNFVYSTQSSLNAKTNFSYLSMGLETAGNLLYGIYNLSNQTPDSSGVYHIFEIPFSQYVRLDFDWKRYFYLTDRNTFVIRLSGGIGIPYGNSMSMPYEKSFYGGGPTTIRAWRIRTLGPGGYVNTLGTNFERVGDISLTANIEDRFKLFGFFEGAAFIDAGNVWLLHESEEFPDGEFRFDKFYQQIALGAGLGLRAKISILTLRLDFAVPIYDPGADDGQPWTFTKLKFKNIVTNFGIDYPF